MKFAIIFLISCSLACAAFSTEVSDQGEGHGYIWGRRWDSNRRYECQYVAELQMISCFRGLVECEALGRFDDLKQTYETFAIGTTDNVKFQLYPRNFSDKQYQDCHVPLIGGGLVCLSLLSSASNVEQNQRGIWIKDAACAKKLIELVTVINPEPKLVQIANQQKVSVFGYVVQITQQAINDSNVNSERPQVIPFGKSLINRAFKNEPVLEKLWKSEDSNRRSECIYSNEAETLTCFRGLVNCEASLTELKDSYEVFGLGTTDMIKYHLYPRRLSDNKYSDYKAQSKSGSVVELSLFKSGVDCNGLKVRDAICYQRIVDTLRVLNEPNTTPVEGDQQNTKVLMMGSILSLDSQQNGDQRMKTVGRIYPCGPNGSLICF